MADLVRDKKVEGIRDLRDESARGEVRIVVDLKNGAFPEKILHALYKYTDLELTFHFNGPDGEQIYSSPPLPTDWNSIEEGLRASGFATLQIGLNLRAMPFQKYGVYTAALYCDRTLLVTFPLSVLPASQPEK